MPEAVSAFFFFNDTATTEIYTLSLHDALPISLALLQDLVGQLGRRFLDVLVGDALNLQAPRSEEHTSELQSQSNLVCRLLLEKKKSWSKRLHRPPPNNTGTALQLVTWTVLSHC